MKTFQKDESKIFSQDNLNPLSIHAYIMPHSGNKNHDEHTNTEFHNPGVDVKENAKLMQKY